MTLPGLEPRPLDPESSPLTTRPPCLPHASNEASCKTRKISTTTGDRLVCLYSYINVDIAMFSVCLRRYTLQLVSDFVWNDFTPTGKRHAWKRDTRDLPSRKRHAGEHHTRERHTRERHTCSDNSDNSLNSLPANNNSYYTNTASNHHTWLW